jgi:hemerythrin-like domain-containing protein
MMPIGPLMIEHRLIERMINQMRRHVDQFRANQKVDPAFIDTAVDFVRTYADRCHHGKEENILFRDLKKKSLSEEHNRILNELISEHVLGRDTTRTIVDAEERYIKGDPRALPEIIDAVSLLADFYPRHIDKEDRHFFLPVMNYFTKQEQDAMLAEMYEFDKNLVHALYRRAIEKLEQSGT